MKKLLLVLICISMILAGCGKKVNVVLGERLQEKLTTAEIKEGTKLIEDVITWNNDLGNIDFLDVKKINKLSLELKSIYDRADILKEGGANGNSEVKLWICLFLEHIQKPVMYYEKITIDIDGAEKEYNHILSLCEQGETLQQKYPLNKRELSGYILTLTESIEKMNSDPRYKDQIIQPWERP